MKILVAIANYGNGNRSYVQRLIQEYRNMPFQSELVVLSDRQKTFGDAVEVRVGLPSEDPWSLPFAHKQLFAERVEEYDLFIYSEDDTLIQERNIRAFLDATAVVRPPRIVGFMRYEESSDGERFCSTVHSHFRWKPETVTRFATYTVAEFTNAHSAAFIMTQQQLRIALDSGGFLVEPHSETYDLLCTAATDPYTQCGLQKVIPISHLEDFLLHHLPNKYVGKLGIPLSEMNAQLVKLSETPRRHLGAQLFPTEKRLPDSRYNKSYYEAVNECLLSYLPYSGNVLSIGCGSGELEAAAMARGLRVQAIPIDHVIAESAKLRGVCMLCDAATDLGNFDFAASAAGQKFDAVLLSNVLQHVNDPHDLLCQVASVMSANGIVVGSVLNFGRLKRRRMAAALRRRGYTQTLLRPTTKSEITKWLKGAGLAGSVQFDIKQKHRRFSRLAGGLFDALLGEELVFAATRMAHPEKQTL